MAKKMFQIIGLIFLIVSQFSWGDSKNPSSPNISSDTIQAEPWLEADALFCSNPKWLGGDDAYSIDLGNERILWLFGDSFIATSDNNIRNESVMVRNSVGIQSGYDPSTASIQFYWNSQNSQPQSFFPQENDIWFWPGHGIKLGDKLLILLMAIRSSQDDWFESAGWGAVMISEPGKEPSEWQLEWLDSPANNFNIVVGSGSVIQIEDYVYAFSSEEPRVHNIYLVRWPISQAAAGNLSQLQWWTGNETGWVFQQNLDGKPMSVFSGGQTEFMVHYEPLLGQYLEIQTMGFGPADMAFRLADHPTEPWTNPERFYRPEEHNIKDIMIYAGKAHPHLTGADLILTYATNYFDFGKLVNDESVYYPRFLKATIKQTQ